MTDKRIRRKRPARLWLYHGALQLSASIRGSVFNIQLRTVAAGAALSRSDARKIRDWLNHYIEFSAENDSDE